METRIKTALDGFRKSVLEAHGMDFLIVGSLALHELGMETAEPHDIDMEVKCTPEQEQNIFKLLSDSQKNTMYQMKEKEDYLSNAERRMDKVTWTHKPYLFQWGDVIINVWVVSEFSHEYVTLDSGIKFAKVMSVIRKKIAYQRNKDRAFPNQSRISLPWNGGRKREEFIRCIQSGLPIIRESKGIDKTINRKTTLL